MTIRQLQRNVFTEAALRTALDLSGGSPTKAAQVLGVSRSTVYRWMKKYGIKREVLTR